MIGNDPRYQTIIDAYKRGEFDAPYQSINYTPSPYYNPIYDIRREQIEAGELEEGARFPRPQIDTSQPPASPEAPIDPCPPGYQLIDGVCQPDSMFEQQDRGGRDQQFTGPKITDGIIEGYQELEPMQQKMGTFYQSLSPEMKEEYEKASSYGRGLQYKTDAQGNVIRIVAKSPTFGQLMGDIGGGFSSMLGGIGDAAQQYLTGGGILGSLISAFTPQPPTVSYGGTSDISVSTQPMISPDIIAPTGIVRPGYGAVQPAAPTGIVRPGYGLPTPQIDVVSQQKLQQQQALAAELEKQRQADIAAQQAAALQEAERIRRLEQQRQEEAQRRAQQAAAEAARQRQAEQRRRDNDRNDRRDRQSDFGGGSSFKGGATATGTTRCFHPDTNINGKKIKDIKAGDYINDSLVEGMIQFKMNNPYYLIDGVKVSGSHGVLHDDKWIFVADHPEAEEIKDVTEFVYVPIVKGGTFKINNTTYADYDYHDMVVLGDDEWKKRRGFV